MTAPDGGFSLVEVLVAIAVLGVACVSILGALMSGIDGSSRHRELSTATAWLQSAADDLEIFNRQVCGTAETARAVYENEIRTNTQNSDGWPSSNISVESVKFWDGVNSFTSTCSPMLQLLALKVVSPSNDVTQRIQIVKGDPFVELVTPPPVVDTIFASCTLASFTLKDDTGAVLTSGGTSTVELTKPSAAHWSRPKNDPLTVTLATSNSCSGIMRIHYLFPHKNGHKSFRRTITLRPLHGVANTYIGSWHKTDKFLDGASITLSIQQGRAMSKTWSEVVSGTHTVTFQ